MNSFYNLGFVNSIPFTCANCGLLAPNTDLMYFFTSLAVSTRLLFLVYRVSFRAILELLILVYAVATAIFLAVRSAILVSIAVICRSVSFGL